MDNEMLRELRRRYINAAERAARCAYNMEQHVANGTLPSDEELRAQSNARHELITTRRAYLEAVSTLRSAKEGDP